MSRREWGTFPRPETIGGHLFDITLAGLVWAAVLPERVRRWWR